MHFFDGDLPSVDGLSIGHEAVGTVVELGSAVTSSPSEPRDGLVVTGCGHCAGCGAGDPAICDSGSTIFGFGAGLGGGQAELLAVPGADANLMALSDDVNDEAALLLTDNLATAWTAARRGDVGPGTSVLVVGSRCGRAVRGAMCLVLGAATVYVYDPVAGRTRPAVGFGGTAVGDDTDAELARGDGRPRSRRSHRCSGTDRSLDSAFACVKAGGTISVVGVHDLNPYPIPILTGVFKSITLRMSMAAVQSAWREVVPLVRDGSYQTAGHLHPSPSAGEAPAAYSMVAARSPECVKVMLTT